MVRKSQAKFSPVQLIENEKISWLITGGCGFIGTRLIKQLKEKANYHIRVLDNLDVGKREDLEKIGNFVEGRNDPDLIELIVGDITDPDTCTDAAKGIDIIVHLAANTGVRQSVENPRKDMSTNVIGTFNMLEAARKQGVTRFVFASSGAPVGECMPPIHEELAPHPVSPYGASKLAGEGYCTAYNKSFGVETISLRFGNVYGPGSAQKFSVIAKFIKEVINGKPLNIYGDGSQTRDFIYIDDLVQAIFLAATIKPSRSGGTGHALSIGGEVFQIATNKETTINELVTILISILEEYNFKNISVINSEKRVGDVQRNYSKIGKAENVLGWRVQYDLLTGLRETVKWFLQNIE